jgi:hypothetical protein
MHASDPSRRSSHAPVPVAARLVARSAADRATREPSARAATLVDHRPAAARLAHVAQLARTTQLAHDEKEKLVQRVEATPAANGTGLPGMLKEGIEAMSGLSLDGVRVHYGSNRPAQLGAHAYAQGTDIHVAPGQERHLPHEAWHVVQQAQGRVRSTMQLENGVAINDDRALEEEADVLGARAARA